MTGLDEKETRWTIRVFQLGEKCWHWAITRTTEDSKFQKDGDESSESMAMAMSVFQIAEFEKLDSVTDGPKRRHLRRYLKGENDGYNA